MKDHTSGLNRMGGERESEGEQHGRKVPGRG
jgi:hypothetical protein